MKTSSLDKCSSCPVGWTPFKIGGKQECFKYIGRRKYSQAEYICKQLGARIPLPENKVQNEDFLNSFLQIKPKSTWITLGLSDAKTEGTFTKSDGQIPKYVNWGFARPQGSQTIRTDYDSVYMLTVFPNVWSMKKGTWSDYKESFAGDTICQLICVGEWK